MVEKRGERMRIGKKPIKKAESGTLAEKQYRKFLNTNTHGTHEEIELTIYRGILGMYGLVRRKGD